MKYMYLKVQMRVTICDSFHALMRIESQNKTKSVNVAWPRSRLYHIVENDSAKTVTTKCKHLLFLQGRMRDTLIGNRLYFILMII